MSVLAVIVCFVICLPASLLAQTAVPQFDANESYNYSVMADATVGTVIQSSISASFSSAQQDLLYVRCANSTPPGCCDLFELVAKDQTNQLWRGFLKVKGRLNFQQSPLHHLLLSATYDRPGSPVGYQSVTIHVINVPHLPPVFISQSTATIEEQTENTLIMELDAVDGDYAAQREIRYYIVNDPGGYFRLEEITGRLFNQRPLLLSDPNWSLGYMVITVQAVAMYNRTYIPLDDPLSSTNESLTISLRSSQTAPLIGQSYYTTTMMEKSPINAVVPGLSIVVTSKNLASGKGFVLRLDRYTDRFRISPANGTRTVTSSIIVVNSTLLDLDFGQQYYSFSVIAEDVESGQTSSANVTIRLTDINDHPPVFVSPVFSANVLETAPRNTEVLTVKATDADFNSLLNGNDSILYRLESQRSLFSINSVTGVITVKRCYRPGTCIDYERNRDKQYHLRVTAADRFGEDHFTQTTVLINITDANDNPPIFSQNEYGIDVRENRTTFYPPLFVETRDIDSAYNDNNKSEYMITSAGGAPDGLFVINATSGEITMTRPVRYADTPGNLGNFTLTVTANNPPNNPKYTSVTTVRIIVIPVNLFPPMFTPDRHFETVVLENSPQGMYVITLVATDADSPATPGGQVLYRFQSGSRDQFSIDGTTGVVTVGPVTPLKYATQSVYNISVVASDQGQPQKMATAYLVIRVLPANFSGIVFIPPVIQISVSNDVLIDSELVNITVHKRDPNTTVTYSLTEPYVGRTVNDRVVPLTPEQKRWFHVDPQTGQLTVQGNLSRDPINTWQSLVTAVDDSTSQTATATLIITIREVNAVPPKFVSPWTPTSPYYVQEIPERQPPGAYVTTMVAGEPNNNIIRYRLLNDTGEFDLVPETGLVTIATQLDYDESPNRTFIVVAYDNGSPSLSSTATVLVQLVQINKYPPVFDPVAYSVNVFENPEAGTFVVDVNATDQDTGDYGEIRYRLVDNPNGAFTIDPVTGVTTMMPNAVLDREQTTHIVLSVEAYDCPNTPSQRQSDFATVTVELLDVNDNRPRFTQSIYVTTIPDTFAANRSIITVTARDADSGPNAEITFEIINSTRSGGRVGGVEHTTKSPNSAQGGRVPERVFDVDPVTGVIRNTVDLAGKADVYEMIVQAVDHGIPALSGIAKVTITVLSSDPLPPRWITPPTNDYVQYIREDAKVGTVVLAAYAESQSYGQPMIRYSLIDTNDGHDFRIDPTTGDVLTNATLNYDRNNIYLLKLVATDASSAESVQYMRVIVLQVVIPVFPQYMDGVSQNCCTIDYNFNVSVGSPYGMEIGQVVASTGDRIVPIDYTVLAASSDLFSLDGSTGKVLVNGSLYGMNDRTFTLDIRASYRSYYAVDLLEGCDCANQSDVRVNVAVHAEPPQVILFPRSPLHACLSEDADIGDKVGVFEAVAFYTPSDIVYRLESPVTVTNEDDSVHTISSDLFRLESTPAGAVIYVNKLDNTSNLQDARRFSFRITAVDQARLNATATTTVEVYVTQTQYQVLVTVNDTLTQTNDKLDDITAALAETAHNGFICVAAVKNHINTEGIVVTTETDVYIYVVDGFSKEIINYETYHELDHNFVYDERRNFTVIGITMAYLYWGGFDVIPLAAAIALIILLLLLALLFLICFCCWFAMAACCGDMRAKEPLIMHVAGPPRLLTGFANPLLAEFEDQQLTMPVGAEAAGYGGGALAYTSGRIAYDAGDGDLFESAASRQQLLETSRTFKQEEAAAPGGSGEVRIVAPLGAPRSPASSPTMTASLAPLIGPADTNGVGVADSSGGRDNMASYESTTHFEETTTSYQAADDAMAADANVPAGRRQGDVDAVPRASPRRRPSDFVDDYDDAPRTASRLASGRGLESPTGSGPPPIVALNETGRGPSRIGATLYQAPSPHSGFTATQNVVSSSAARPVDVDQVIFETPGGTIGRQQMPLQQEIVYTSHHPGSVVYDDYDDYRTSQPAPPGMHRPTRIDSANSGVYRGEIQLDSMSGGRPQGSYSEQETRFM